MASWIGLHSFLPSNHSDSEALEIHTDGVNTSIAGGAFNPLTGRNEAALWTKPIPAPGAADTDASAFAGFAGTWFTFDVSTSTSMFGTFDLTSVNAIQFMFESYNGTGGGLGASGWDYSMTSHEVVPAPGAMALLGAAELVGARRLR